jgi:hypothetical protein
MDQPRARQNRTRGRRLLPIATAVLVCFGPFVPGPSQASTPAGEASASGPPIFDYPDARLGAFVALDEHNGFKELAAHRKFEKKWKRKSDFIREFVEWDEPTLITRAEKKLAAGGRTLVLSWSSYEHKGGIRWEEVASGKYDALIDQRAQEVKAFKRPMAFSFQHEPDNQIDREGEPRAGTPAQYCDAYRHVIDRFRAAGVTNATYGVILMAYTADRGRGDQYYCGDDYVEFLGVDGFNWYLCQHPTGPWRMPNDIFKEFYEWGSTYDLPLIISEWGTGEDPAVPGRKAEWITALRTTLKTMPGIKAAMIYNSGTNPGCERYSDTSKSSQRAFIKMGADPYFTHG